MKKIENKKIDIMKAIEKYIKDHQIKNVKLAIVDIDGVLRGKYMSTKKSTGFRSTL